VGWRAWDHAVKRWWGEPYRAYPDKLLDELNGEKRPERIVELQRQAKRLSGW